MQRNWAAHILKSCFTLTTGDSFELCKSCIDMGFSSVMIDGSHLPYEENVALTKKVVDYAHQFDVTVEGELGVLAGVEDEVSAEHHTYTNPEEVIDFATRTGCDSLAISIGTSHGAYKFKPEQCHVDPATGRLVPPPLEFAVLDAVMEKLPGFPIVLHGSSSVLRKKWTLSTNMVANWKLLSVFLKTSCVRLLNLQFARSTSTQTLVWL